MCGTLTVHQPVWSACANPWLKPTFDSGYFKTVCQMNSVIKIYDSCANAIRSLWNSTDYRTENTCYLHNRGDFVVIVKE
jgi:hypothetical protein